jgi:hypothetical protein
MTNHSILTNQTVTMTTRTSILNDIELDAAVGGSFLSAVKAGVMEGAQTTAESKGLICGCRGGPRR